MAESYSVKFHRKIITLGLDYIGKPKNYDLITNLQHPSYQVTHEQYLYDNRYKFFHQMPV